MITSQDHTFVICAYKVSPYLKKCIKSLLNQTTKSKIIMCTSTPNDYIRDMARKYGIELFIRNGESGLARDWNFAISCVKTQFYTLCHQDDYYFSKYGENVLKAINQTNLPIIIYTNYAEDKNGKLETKNTNLRIKAFLNSPLKIKRLQNNIWIRRRILSVGNPICCPAVTFNREGVGEEIFNERFLNAVDWDVWERLSKKKGAFVYCPQVLMAHRVHENSTTTLNIKNNIRTKEDLIIFQRFWPRPLAKIIAKIFSISEWNNK